MECQLRRHHLIHTDVRHKCTQCDRSFRTTYSLKKHVETHTGTIPRPFVCDFCQMGFRHRMDLKVERNMDLFRNWLYVQIALWQRDSNHRFMTRWKFKSMWATPIDCYIISAIDSFESIKSICCFYILGASTHPHRRKAIHLRTLLIEFPGGFHFLQSHAKSTRSVASHFFVFEIDPIFGDFTITSFFSSTSKVFRCQSERRNIWQNKCGSKII